MERIIQQLKEQREKAEKTFIKNSFIKRNCKINEPCPDTDADLDIIAELNEAISVLEYAMSSEKEFVFNYAQPPTKYAQHPTKSTKER